MQSRQAKRDIHAHQLQTTIAPIQNDDVQTSKIQAPSSSSPMIPPYTYKRQENQRNMQDLKANT